ncbi:MAG TPA: CBS domain-containing protein [Micromonosporaceae bacterium]|nr:CBS domain-containing protein [Micromonosporaceae bacterium]
MTTPVVTVRVDDPLEQATAVLTSNNITSAPVVDSNGDLVGMVSEIDLLRGRVLPDETPPGVAPGRRPTVVADVMTETVVTMPPDADVAEVAQAMLDVDVRGVPVVDDFGSLRGIISRRDILRTVVRTDDVIQADLQQRLDAYADGKRQWVVTVDGGVARVAGRFADEVEEKVIGALARTVPGVTEVKLASSPQ